MLDAYRDLIDDLLGAPAVVRKAVAGHAGEDDSAPRALLALMRDRDAVVLERLDRMRKEANAHLRALPDAASAPLPVADGSLEELLAAFELCRGDLVSLLMNLTLKDWERTGTHEIAGEISIADEVETHVEFDEAMCARVATSFR